MTEPTPFFRAVATDLDGTLTSDGQVASRVLDAIARARDANVRMLLVTGRILSELREEHPELEHAFDRVVAENWLLETVARRYLRLTETEPSSLDR